MRLAVVGTGLIGGSFALAARRRGVFDRIVGIEPNPGRASRALALGVIDELAEAVPDDADAVLLAGPGGTIAPWVGRLAGHSGIVFDAGSVKGALLAALRTNATPLPERFVPCHPLAGSEQSGPDAADPALFEGAEVILTPAPETSPAALAQVSAWWQSVGGHVTTMDAAEHDAVLAVTSHLPHLLAVTYLQQVEAAHLPHAASGFRDFTRIGAADAEVWSAIFQHNREALLASLGDFERSLGEVRRLLQDPDETRLRAFIEAARRRRGGHADD